MCAKDYHRPPLRTIASIMPIWPGKFFPIADLHSGGPSHLCVCADGIVVCPIASTFVLRVITHRLRHSSPSPSCPHCRASLRNTLTTAQTQAASLTAYVFRVASTGCFAAGKSLNLARLSLPNHPPPPRLVDLVHRLPTHRLISANVLRCDFSRTLKTRSNHAHNIVDNSILALLSGCQSPSSDPAFADVQHLTADRAGVQIRWNRSSADDRAVASAVDDLLSHELTADQAVEIALLNNHSLQAIYAQLGIAQADLVQAGLLANPVFDASIRFPDKSPKGPDVELSISQEFIDLLFIPGARSWRRRSSSRPSSRSRRLSSIGAADARSAYYTLVAAQQMLELRKTAADAMHLAANCQADARCGKPQ